MATRAKKKPLKRKSKATTSNRRLGTFGWAAAGLVGCAWAASDGRALHQVSTVLAGLDRTVRTEQPLDRVAALIRDEPKPGTGKALQPVPARSATPSRPRSVPLPEERTGSIHPSPRPLAQIARLEVPVPVPAKMPLQPLSAPPVEYTLRQTRTTPLPAPGLIVGEERHATRALAAHEAPDASSRSGKEVASGSSVAVLRSAGDWRYVRDMRSGTEGWVDGRFLAGQSMSADLAVLAQEDVSRRR